MRYYSIIISTLIILVSGCSDKGTNAIVEKPIVSESVKIGNQVWMLKNLDVDHYRNGEPITEIKDSAVWANGQVAGWCYYNNDPKNGKIYGKLYNWAAVNDSRGLAPIGWHIASDSDWTKLVDLENGYHNAGFKLKEAGAEHWTYFAGTYATNESGFTALPGGGRSNIGNFLEINTQGFWWTSTTICPTTAIYYDMINIASSVNHNQTYRSEGMSVRCVKD